MSKLRREIKDMKKIRDTSGAAGCRATWRRSRSSLHNAGKSSLLNALTGAGVLVEKRVVRHARTYNAPWQFDDGRPFVLTDTVGFVRHLPTQLVEAFRSTLEEVVDAELLVHVIDGSDVNPLAQVNAVRQVVKRRDPGVRHRAAAGTVGGQQDRRGKWFVLAQLRRELPDAVFNLGHTGRRPRPAAQPDGRARRARDATVDVTFLRPRRPGCAHARRRSDRCDRAHRLGHAHQGAGAGSAGCSLRDFATF